jgi:hypothetical protein
MYGTKYGTNIEDVFRRSEIGCDAETFRESKWFVAVAYPIRARVEQIERAIFIRSKNTIKGSRYYGTRLTVVINFIEFLRERLAVAVPLSVKTYGMSAAKYVLRAEFNDGIALSDDIFFCEAAEPGDLKCVDGHS